KAQIHTFGVLREERKIDAFSVPRRTQLRRTSWPNTHMTNSEGLNAKKMPDFFFWIEANVIVFASPSVARPRQKIFDAILGLALEAQRLHRNMNYCFAHLTWVEVHHREKMSLLS